MKKKKIIALLLAASMMVMPLPAIAADTSAGGSEDTGGWQLSETENCEDSLDGASLEKVFEVTAQPEAVDMR